MTTPGSMRSSGYGCEPGNPSSESIEQAMGSDIFREQHPDWRVTQRSVAESVC